MHIIWKLKLCNAFNKLATRGQHYTKRENISEKEKCSIERFSFSPLYLPSISILSITILLYIIPSIILSNLKFVTSHFSPTIYSLRFTHSFLMRDIYWHSYKTHTHQGFGVTVLFSDVTEVPRDIGLEPDVLSVQSWFLLKYKASN